MKYWQLISQSFYDFKLILKIHEYAKITLIKVVFNFVDQISSFIRIFAAFRTSHPYLFWCICRQYFSFHFKIQYNSYTFPALVLNLAQASTKKPILHPRQQPALSSNGSYKLQDNFFQKPMVRRYSMEKSNLSIQPSINLCIFQ